MIGLDNAALHSADAEMSVLGSLLLVPDAIDRVGELTEFDFFVESNRLIFRRIATMIAHRQAVDVVTVSDALAVSGELDRAGGMAYLIALAGGVAGAASIRRYAEIVIDKRMLRDLTAVAGEIAEIASAANGLPAIDRIDLAQSKLLDLSKVRDERSEPSAIGEVIGDLVDELERRSQAGGGITGVSTGFADLDAKTKGLQPGSLIVIAGRPSMGKTTLAINIAENVALNGGVSLVFSMEMPKVQIAEKVFSSIGSIELDAITGGQLSGEDFSRLTAAIGRLESIGLVIDDSSALSVAQMSGRARRIKRKRGRLDLIVIDYLQLMSSGKGKASNRNEEIGEITRGLKLMARDLGVPVIALSQLSRKVEERTDKRPMMSDLRESGAIEQDADVVMMAYRDDYYDQNSPVKGLAEVLIRKNRMGGVGDVRMVFQGGMSRFRDADQGAVAAAMEAARSLDRQTRRRGFDG